jgi:mono/diheme cytochrome c family protein
MTRSARMSPAGFVTLLPLMFAAFEPAWAQNGNEPMRGMRLFNQSCRVCHTKPQLNSPQYGPALSMNTLGGNVEAMRQFISNGTPRMPGFKYTFKPAEIDAIVAYIRTIPAPAPAAAAPTSGKSGASPSAD